MEGPPNCPEGVDRTFDATARQRSRSMEPRGSVGLRLPVLGGRILRRLRCCRGTRKRRSKCLHPEERGPCCHHFCGCLQPFRWVQRRHSPPHHGGEKIAPHFRSRRSHSHRSLGVCPHRSPQCTRILPIVAFPLLNRLHLDCRDGWTAETIAITDSMSRNLSAAILGS